MKRRVIIISVASAAVLVLLLGKFPCQIRQYLGIPCPSCGMIRSYTALLHGDFLAAVHYHPLFWMPPAALLLVAAAKGARTRRIIAVAAILLYLAVYVIRMITLFPDTPPMDVNRDAAAIRLIERIIK